MENSKIEWTDHTFNPWIGCSKVSPACDCCYAERFGARMGVSWGEAAARKRTSESTWNQVLAWDRKAEAEGKPASVFCASLADVFDDHPSIEPSWFRELLELIELTRNLRWLLLTKRTGNILPLIKAATGTHMSAETWFQLNPHVGVGATVEDQPRANARIPELLKVPAAFRFISMEPLRRDVDLPAMGPNQKLDWIIVGGESGPGARTIRKDNVLYIRNQARKAGIPFFFKSWGDWVPDTQLQHFAQATGINPYTHPDFSLKHCVKTEKDAGPLGCRSAKRIHTNGGWDYFKVGKEHSGALIDGQACREWPGWLGK